MYQVRSGQGQKKPYAPVYEQARQQESAQEASPAVLHAEQVPRMTALDTPTAIPPTSCAQTSPSGYFLPELKAHFPGT